jgi:diguanylate cyclase (GGDEF)-like protein/putative nucleotidyltransferase with HDIG domain
MNNEPTKEPAPNVRVLVLDDEAPIRRLVKSALTDIGCVVETAADGREGLQILLQRDFDVLVVDLKMKGMDGIAFLQEALKIWPWLGVIIITGYADTHSMARANALGVETIMAKPIRMDQLRENVLREAGIKRQKVMVPASLTLDRIQYQLGVLRQLSETAIASLSLAEALRGLSSGLINLLPSALVGVLGLEGDEEVLLLNVREKISDAFVQSVQDEILKRYAALSGRSLSLKSLRIEVDGLPTTPDGQSRVGSTFSVPVMKSGAVHGILTFASTAENAYTTQDISFLYHAANHLSTVFAALSKMRQMATHDPLTGLCNRRQLEEEMERAWLLSQRYDQSICLVIIDIDHFKTLNDTFGHLVGDQALREVTRLLMNVARASDILARYGGDELVVVLPQADQAEARVFCERLIREVRQHLFCKDLEPLKLTVSIGVADNRSWGQPSSVADVLAQADHALYAAKKGGRDRMCVWSDIAGQAEESANRPAAAARTPAVAGTKSAGRILVVDDDRAVGMVLQQMLESEHYEVRNVMSVSEAILELTQRRGEFDIVLTDLEMPDRSGFDLLTELGRADRSIVKIVVSGHATTDNAISCIRHGAYDFIEKPIHFDHLLTVVQRAQEYRRLIKENERYQLYLEEMVSEKSRALTDALEELKKSYKFTLEAMVAMLDARERATGQHSVRVRDLASILARHLGISGKELEDIGHGALLHDIGKIALPDAVLLKPGPLTDAEWEVMKTHAEIGYNIVRSSPYLRNAAQIVLSHQEHYDGTGYPRALKGEEICLGARIFTVVDAYDAMRSNRIYRRSIPEDDAVAELIKGKGKHFDPAIVDAFLECRHEIEQAGNWRLTEDAAPSPPTRAMVNTRR